MEDLATRGAPLEYWFWKATFGEHAVIIDYIVRRAINEAELRVGTWSAGQPAPVVHHRSGTWAADRAGIRIDDHVLDERGARGTAGACSWSIAWDLGPARFEPRPSWFGPFHSFDLESIIRPAAAMQGTLTIEDVAIPVDGPGTVTHYWGRRLPPRWVWMSATGFDDEPLARLEAFWFRSRTWGRPPTIPAGFVWSMTGGRSDSVVMPLTGAVSARSDGVRARLQTIRLDGRRHVVEASAPEASFNDIGEDIRQSMAATLRLDGRRATGVGLEFRGR